MLYCVGVVEVRPMLCAILCYLLYLLVCKCWDEKVETSSGWRWIPSTSVWPPGWPWPAPAPPILTLSWPLNWVDDERCWSDEKILIFCLLLSLLSLLVFSPLGLWFNVDTLMQAQLTKSLLCKYPVDWQFPCVHNITYNTTNTNILPTISTFH